MAHKMNEDGYHTHTMIGWIKKVNGITKKG